MFCSKGVGGGLHLVIAGLIGAALLCLVVSGVIAETTEQSAYEDVVLDTQGFWRTHVTLRAPLYGTSQDAQPGELPARRGWWSSKTIGHPPKTPWPSADWISADFDDRAWLRGMGPFYAGYGQNYPSGLALLCLRGKFVVSDPAEVKDLTLSVSFRGGIVVYLNGKEVLRSHLQKGNITFETPAEDYPVEVYNRPDGQPFGHYDYGKPEFKPLLERRIRRVTRVPIPATFLRKGVNVLALEVHRSVLHEGLAKRNGIPDYVPTKGVWTPCGLCSLQLKSSNTDVVLPNIARPRGLQAWNSCPLLPVFDMDYGDPHETLEPVYLVGTPGGSFSGQVVVGCDVPIKGLRAHLTDLKRADGKEIIPAASTQVRYGTLDGRARTAPGWRPGLDRGLYSFQALAETPPVEVPVRKHNLSDGYSGLPYSYGAVQPIWVTVNVPPDALSAEYEGRLKIHAEGHKEIEAAVKIRVCTWKLPDPRDYRTFMDIYQSPESVALRYGVPLWSDEHFALMAQTFKFLGSMGNKTLYVPLISKTGLGNEESMVRWIRKAGGGYQHDLGVLQRYLDLAIKHQGKPQVLCFIVWDLKHKYIRAETYDSPTVTVLDETTGLLQEMKGPKYEDEARQVAFWKPLAESLLELVNRRGLADAMMLGHANDLLPPDAVLHAWGTLWPGKNWVQHAHHVTTTFKTKQHRTGFVSSVYRPRLGADRSVIVKGEPAPRLFGWNRPRDRILVRNMRNITRLSGSLVPNRLVAEAVLEGGGHGRGALAADFFPVPTKDRSGKVAPRENWRPIAGRYLPTNWNYVGFHANSLVAGPNGAISTITFEMIREGVQECEAKIFLEKALLDDKTRGKLPADLADRCWKLLDQRKRATLTNLLMRGQYRWLNELYAASGWQARSQELFNAAGEVAEALYR